MGAEFIGTFIAMPTITKDDALARVAAMSDIDCIAAYEHRHDESIDPATARAEHIDTVTTFFDSIINESREVDFWLIGGIDYVVTGGMSWGDTPTEAFDVIEQMHALNRIAQILS